MKKSVVYILGSAILIAVGACKDNPKTNFGQVLDMNISLEGDILQKSTPNILTLTVENTSKDKIVLTESSFMLEFTSYSGSVKKTLYVDPFGNIFSTEELPQERLVLKGNSVLSARIDLGKAIFCTIEDEEGILPVDDYTVDLIIFAKPSSKITKNEEIIRSNYADIQVKV